MGFGRPGSFQNLHTGSLPSGASSSLGVWVGPCVHTDTCTHAHTHVHTCPSRMCAGWSHWKGPGATRAWGSALMLLPWGRVPYLEEPCGPPVPTLCGLG